MTHGIAKTVCVSAKYIVWSVWNPKIYFARIVAIAPLWMMTVKNVLHAMELFAEIVKISVIIAANTSVPMTCAAIVWNTALSAACTARIAAAAAAMALRLTNAPNAIEFYVKTALLRAASAAKNIVTTV